MLRRLGIRHATDRPTRPCFVCVDGTTGALCDRRQGPGSPYNLCDRHVERLVNAGSEARRWNAHRQIEAQLGIAAAAKRPRHRD